MPPDSGLRSKTKPLPFRDLLVTRVIIATCAYAATALIEISFRAVQPVFYATPIEMGGLGLDASAIGIILAMLGILNGVLQLLFFVRLHDWLGGRNLYLFSVFSCFPMFALFPAISFAAKAQGLSYFVYLLVGLQLLAFVISYSAFGMHDGQSNWAEYLLCVTLQVSYSCTSMHLHPTEHPLAQQMGSRKLWCPSYELLDRRWRTLLIR